MRGVSTSGPTSLPSDVVSMDQSMLPAHNPEADAYLKKKQDINEKMRKQDEKYLKPKQLEAAQQLQKKVVELEEDPMKKAVLERKIAKYLKAFPELKELKIPTDRSKKSEKELKAYIGMIESQLGAKAPIDFLGMGYKQLAKQVEDQQHHYQFFGLHLQGLSKVVEASFDQDIHPLLVEFSIKYDEWFVSSVEARLIQTTLGLILQTHRMNVTGAQVFVEKAATTQAPTTLAQKIKKV